MQDADAGGPDLCSVSGSDYAMLWSGTAWGSIQTLDTSGGSLTSVNVAFETQSGRVMAVYGKPTATSVNLFYRLWNGSSWSWGQAPATVSSEPPAASGAGPKPDACSCCTGSWDRFWIP